MVRLSSYLLDTTLGSEKRNYTAKCDKRVSDLGSCESYRDCLSRCVTSGLFIGAAEIVSPCNQGVLCPILVLDSTRIAGVDRRPNVRNMDGERKFLAHALRNPV